jgi:two-component system, chemotaxis family, sensor kinase CheA
MGASSHGRDANLLREYVEDSLQMLSEFDLGMRKVQTGTAPAPVVDHMFRVIHSIKGNAGFFGGFQAVRGLAHLMEDVLDGVRRGGRGWTAAEHGLLTEGCELLAQTMRAHLAGGDALPPALLAQQEDYGARVSRYRAQPPPSLASAPAGEEAGTSLSSPSAPTVRIDLAGLQALGGEIRAVRDGLAELVRVAPAAAGLKARVERLVQMLDEMRTVPLHRLFDRLPAMVGSLAETLGKSVVVQTEGGDLRAPRAMFDPLEAALVHLIRNALDHGIERQDVRLRRGKPPVGRLTVVARRARSGIALAVEDDGGGIDPKRMRLEAVVRKLMSEAEAAALPDDEAIALVFRPGFSTAPATTDLSGRGVGMDAVRTAIRQIGGEVRIDSTPRKGTVIVLELPIESGLPDAASA